MPFPRTYAAVRSVAPVSSSSVGEPATVTGSPNVTLTCIVRPGPYVPLAFGDETATTPGASASTAILLWALSEAEEPGIGRRALT